MAMTKKEKAEVDALIARADELVKQAQVLAALRWTEPVPRDLPVPKGYPCYTEGYDYSAHSCVVRQAWSETVAHGDGPYPKGARYRSAAQGGRALYSTKLLALKALRHAVERKAAEELHKIDLQIAAEKESASAN